MKTPKYRRKQKHGFSLTEILVVVTIIALLIAILIPVTSRVLAAARVNSSVAEIRALRTVVADAASRLGGTLPLTEGIAAADADQVTFSATLTARLPVANRISDFTKMATLNNVLMNLNPPLLESSFKASMGVPFLWHTSFPPIVYDAENKSFDSVGRTRSGSDTFTYMADWMQIGGRLECAPVSSFFSVITSLDYLNNQQINPAWDPAGLINDPANPKYNPARMGVNFVLDGVNSLPEGSRCAYVVYEKVPLTEAYELSKQLNPANLLVRAKFSTQAQTLGRVVYNGKANSSETTTVYVYLAHF